MSRRGPLMLIIVAVLVAVIEVGAALGGLGGEGLDLVPGWGLTRPGDVWALALTVSGCAGLFAVLRFPVAALMITSGAYIVFILRDYEFGMTLPAMVAILVLAARGGRQLPALIAAVACVGATCLWIAQRTATIPEGGVTVLSWVAFGTVSVVFFLLPALVGELVRLRRLAAHRPDRPTSRSAL